MVANLRPWIVVAPLQTLAARPKSDANVWRPMEQSHLPAAEPFTLTSDGLSRPEPSVRARTGATQPPTSDQGRGEVLTAISDGLVGLLKEFYGRGPTRAKSYFQDDLVVCVLRGGFSRVEQTLLDGGRGEAVIQQRMEFQELMRDRFIEVIEDATGQRVIGFMSGNQQSPDLMLLFFILAPTDLITPDQTQL